MRTRLCNCILHQTLDSEACANFYNENFIPWCWEKGWLSFPDSRFLRLTGYCKSCGGELEETICLPPQSDSKAFFKAVYDTLRTAHPYDQKSEQLGYFGACERRSEFYRRRDQIGTFQFGQIFLNLFCDYDREQARIWLEENHSPQAYTQVYRATGRSLFCEVVRIARENGDFSKADAILDYVLPSRQENGTGPNTELVAYEFDFFAVASYGASEGIYLDCYLQGKFDQSGRFRLHIGTLKTLDDSLEAMKIMGELGGALTVYARRYVNENLHRFTPDEELEREAKRLKPQNTEGGGAHVDSPEL